MRTRIRVLSPRAFVLTTECGGEIFGAAIFRRWLHLRAGRLEWHLADVWPAA